MPVPVSLLVLLFISAEIVVFVLAGRWMGAAGTLGLTLLATVAGVVILKRQSVAILMRVRSELAAGRAPGGPVADAALTGAGALLLVLPGFLSDIAGLLLLAPPVRRAIRSQLSRRFTVRAATRGSARSGDVVELHPGEYRSRPGSDTPWRQGPGDRRPAEGE